MSAAVRKDPLAHYRSEFDAVRSRLPAVAAREAALARFLELGFPTTREEAWKYTNLRRLETRTFGGTSCDESAALAVSPAELGLPRLVLVNGWVRGEAAALDPATRVQHGAAAFAAAAHSRVVRLPRGGGTERFAALNAALTTDPLLIDVQATVQDAALHVACLSGGPETSMSHPRMILSLAAGARLRLVLEHAGDDGAERWINAAIDAELGAGAVLEVFRLQRQGPRTFHTERIDVRVAAGASVTVHDASVGATLARLDVNIALQAPGASATASGLFFADESRHLDTQVRIDHCAGHTTSLQEYRGIAAGRGRGVFNTKVVVHAHAQKSSARQSSRNLLLTSGAEIDTKPELEIYADDVQCSHGATTGQLDPAALFYLRSRGITAHEARRALTRAFAGSVLARMDLPEYSAAVHRELDGRLDRLLEA
jgi:Fe-S cluster assembly protein SufD